MEYCYQLKRNKGLIVTNFYQLSFTPYYNKNYEGQILSTHYSFMLLQLLLVMLMLIHTSGTFAPVGNSLCHKLYVTLECTEYCLPYISGFSSSLTVIRPPTRSLV